MPSITVTEQWYANGVLTDLDTPAVLCDGTGTLGIYDNTASSNVVAANTAMTRLSVGTYQYAYAGGTAGHTYTAYRKCTYLGATYIFPQVISLPSVGTGPTPMNVSFGSLQQKLCRFLFGQWSTLTGGQIVPGTGNTLVADQVSDINACIKEGLQMVYAPMPLVPGRPAHEWSFMRPTVTLTTQPPYTAGTVTVANGVVSGTATAFTSSMVGAVMTLNVSSAYPYSGSYTIASYQSPGQVTLSNTGVNQATATTFSVNYYTYNLPANFGGIVGPLQYAVGMSEYYPPVRITKEVEVRRRLADYMLVMRPEIAAIVSPATMSFSDLALTNPQLTNVSTDVTQGTSWQIMFYPVPDAMYVLSYTMKAMPFMLDATNQYPLGGNVISQLIDSACMAASERLLDDSEGIYNRKFESLLAAAIDYDRSAMSPDTLGYTTDPSEIPIGDINKRYETNSLMTYLGQVYY